MAFRKWLLHRKTFYTWLSPVALKWIRVSGSYGLSLDTAAVTAMISRAFLKQKQKIMQQTSSITGPSSHLLLFPIYTSKAFPFHYIRVFELHWAKAHNLLYVVFGMPGLFASTVRWPNMEIKAKQIFPPPPAPCGKGRMTWRFWTCSKTWCLMIVSLSLLSSVLATLRWGGVVWFPPAAGTGCWWQQVSGSTERGWHLLEKSPLAESCCSAAEHSHFFCLDRKESKTWRRKGAAAMWGSDEQGQQAKGQGLCEKRNT